ncbi:hypothetical protein [Frankia gtarii]|uniref:hypothetical protein n=1 Tax=Frankia gtarii TaxID=2950102 RepID=UPI0021BFC015|nr:hypothetical protein [Frankia gtarii]
MADDGLRAVTSYWPTRIWVGQYTPALRQGHPWRSAPCPAGTVRLCAPAQFLADPEVCVAQLGQLVRQTAGVAEITVTARVEQWGEGYEVPHGYSPADWQLWCYLDGTGEDDSAALALHDPRAGAASTLTLPGLPWGRPLIVAARPGMLVVHPGWVSYAVHPVGVGHQPLVLTAAITLSPGG